MAGVVCDIYHGEMSDVDVSTRASVDLAVKLVRQESVEPNIIQIEYIHKYALYIYVFIFCVSVICPILIYMYIYVIDS